MPSNLRSSEGDSFFIYQYQSVCNRMKELNHGRTVLMSIYFRDFAPSVSAFFGPTMSAKWNIIMKLFNRRLARLDVERPVVRLGHP